MYSEKLIILDFGGASSSLLARRIRDAEYIVKFCRLIPRAAA
ncbi:MAG: hypothetical protein ACTTH8_03690 [Treponema sp.]